MTDLQAAEQKINQIMHNTELSTNAKIQAVLDQGCEIFKLSLGILSHIERKRYKVEFVSPVDSGLQPGTLFDLPRTYCDITVKLKYTLGIPNMGKSEYNLHPCYSDFSLESYFGTPIILDGAIYGTLNFTDKNPYPTKFTPEQKQIIEAMAAAVAGLLRERTKTEVTTPSS